MKKIALATLLGFSFLVAADDVDTPLKAQYRELQAFSQFGSDLDADTKARLDRGERIVEILKQGQASPLSVAEQVIIIYAANKGYLKEIDIKDIPEFEKQLFKFLEGAYPNLGKSMIEHNDIIQRTALWMFGIVIGQGHHFNG